MLGDTEVQELLVDIIGEEDGITVVQCLINGITTDDEIAEKTDLRLNVVRKVLYKLYDAGLASYKRSKDPQTQWYTYSWKFEEDRIFDIMKKRKENIFRELRECLEYEKNNIFFICKNNGCRYNYETAAENNFTCPDCGSTLEFQDNSAVIKELEGKIHLLES